MGLRIKALRLGWGGVDERGGGEADEAKMGRSEFGTPQGNLGSSVGFLQESRRAASAEDSGGTASGNIDAG
jgi:hypothetical protein